MTFKEFIAHDDIDVDVYDDYADGPCCAFAGPCNLTDEGKEYFKDLMDLPVTINEDTCEAIVHYFSTTSGTETDRIEALLSNFIWWFAGFCPSTIWDYYFKDTEDTEEEDQSWKLK